VPQMEELTGLLTGVVQPGDVLLTLGAGSIGAAAIGLRDAHADVADGRTGVAT
jgi:UDP-N-acetylmuramate-alanine ligase